MDRLRLVYLPSYYQYRILEGSREYIGSHLIIIKRRMLPEDYTSNLNEIFENYITNR